jgi:hypothetical protein
VYVGVLTGLRARAHARALALAELFESRCSVLCTVARRAAGTECVRLRVRLRACVRACGCVCFICVCAHSRAYKRGWALLRRRALLRGTLGLLRWYLRDINGTQRVLGGALLLMGCTLGYVGATPRKCVRACDAVHLLGSYDTSRRGRTTLHGSSRRTDSTQGVLDEYSHRLYVVRSIAARASAQTRLQPRLRARRTPSRRPSLRRV